MPQGVAAPGIVVAAPASHRQHWRRRCALLPQHRMSPQGRHPTATGGGRGRLCGQGVAHWARPHPHPNHAPVSSPRQVFPHPDAHHDAPEGAGAAWVGWDRGAWGRAAAAPVRRRRHGGWARDAWRRAAAGDAAWVGWARGAWGRAAAAPALCGAPAARRRPPARATAARG